MRRLAWLRILVLVGWVVIIPPITSDMQGFYVGADGRPASVAVEDPLFQWTVYGHYQSGAECGKARRELVRRSLHLDPDSATAVAWSFAKCLQDNDPLLRPNQGPTERLPAATSGQPVMNASH
jgi:hypothetical protein